MSSLIILSRYFVIYRVLFRLNVNRCVQGFYNANYSCQFTYYLNKSTSYFCCRPWCEEKNITRGAYGNGNMESLHLAIVAVISGGCSLNCAANDFQIPEANLRRYVKKTENEYPRNLGRYKPIFSAVLENKPAASHWDAREYYATKPEAYKTNMAA